MENSRDVSNNIALLLLLVNVVMYIIYMLLLGLVYSSWGVVITSRIALSLIAYIASCMVHILLVYRLTSYLVVSVFNRLFIVPYIYYGVHVSSLRDLVLRLELVPIVVLVFLVLLGRLRVDIESEIHYLVGILNILVKTTNTRVRVNLAMLSSIIASHAISLSLLLSTLTYLVTPRVIEKHVDLYLILLVSTTLPVLVLTIYTRPRSFRDAIVRGMLSGWGLLGVIPLILESTKQGRTRTSLTTANV